VTDTTNEDLTSSSVIYKLAHDVKIKGREVVFQVRFPASCCFSGFVHRE